MTALRRPGTKRCPSCQEFRYVGQFTAQVILDKDPSRLHTVTSDVCRDCQRRARKPRDWR